MMLGMDEPTLVRCARCSALIALQDAFRCEYHETDPVCGFCWKHHVAGVESIEECWTLVGCLDWR